MKKLLTLTLLVCLSTVGVHAKGFSANLRATYLETRDRSDAFSALGLNFAAGAVSVSDKWIPEVDLRYEVNEYITTELVLTIPQTHTVKLAGVGSLGDFKHLPPTLYVQFNPMPGKKFRPYAGVGVNYTLIFDDDLKVANVPLSLENHSLGLAGQVGFDYAIDEHMYFNVDFKVAVIRSGVFAGTAKLTQARLDPYLYSVGGGYKF
ncbi:MAG: OmpW family outer membrane protein [Opitutaceae bacterium]|nr:OmpW family outer membrane protein [Opitutaceae bacterium]